MARFGIKQPDNNEPTLPFDEDLVHESEKSFLSDLLEGPRKKMADSFSAVIGMMFNGEVRTLPPAPIGSKGFGQPIQRRLRRKK